MLKCFKYENKYKVLSMPENMTTEQLKQIYDNIEKYIVYSPIENKTHYSFTYNEAVMSPSTIEEGVAKVKQHIQKKITANTKSGNGQKKRRNGKLLKLRKRYNIAPAHYWTGTVVVSLPPTITEVECDKAAAEIVPYKGDIECILFDSIEEATRFADEFNHESFENHADRRYMSICNVEPWFDSKN